MKKLFPRILAYIICTVMVFQCFGTVFAEDDPTKDVIVNVPETLQDGQNYYFIPSDYTISEKSDEQLIIPIQRTGDVSESAEITLKVIDMTARYGENYTAEVYRGDDADVKFGGLALVDLFTDPDYQDDVEMDEISNALGEIISENGGVDLVSTEGDVIGTFNALRPDEYTNDTSDVTDTSVSDEECDVSDEEADLSEAQSLRAARDSFTGTVSDRQQLDGGNSFTEALSGVSENVGTDISSEELAEENYPGREFKLSYKAGQTVRFLIVTPMYSDAADGDASIMLMLKDLPDGFITAEDFNFRSVNIKDEDPFTAPVVSLASEEITAQDGTAAITVTRQGRINSVVGVMLSSADGTAVAGDDYGGVGAKLYFPMGVESRTVELPVGHGAEDKDFNVYISVLSTMPDVELGISSAHVTIPAGEPTGEGTLLDDSADMLGEEWNLRERFINSSAGFKYKSDYSIFLETQDDKLQTRWAAFRTDWDYAWDGVHIEYNIHTWYSMVKFRVQTMKNGKWYDLYLKDYGDCSRKADESADVYFGTECNPYRISIDDICYEIHNGFRDSYTDLEVYSVNPIKRKFTIKLQTPEALEYEGMNESQILADYENSVLADSFETSGEYLTGDHFSISRLGTHEWSRLTGVVAVAPNGKTLTISGATAGDGKSSSIDVELSPALITRLAENGFITWKKDSSGSYSGTINVRPVYSYVNDITVNVRDDSYGAISYNGKTLDPGTYTFHYGDKLTFHANETGESTAAGLRPVGIGYLTRKDNAAGQLTSQSDCEYFITGTNGAQDSPTVTLTEDYYEFWQVFSDQENSVQVRVADEDLEYFDTTTGLFTGLTASKDIGGYSYYSVKPSTVTNEFIELLAVTADDGYVPVWKLPNNSKIYSGNTFWFNAGVKAGDNIVTLSADRNVSDHAYYMFSGTTYTSILNLATGHDSDDVITVQGAAVAVPYAGATSDPDGNFQTTSTYLVGNTYVRYLVMYNGQTVIREKKLASASADKVQALYMSPDGQYSEVEAVSMTLGGVELETWTSGGAHFSEVVVSLGDFNSSAINAVEMNGKKLVVEVTVDPGTGYITTDDNGDLVTVPENVTGVVLYFQNQLTGEVHGTYSTVKEEGKEKAGLEWDAETNTATLTINEFKPDSPALYTYGDILMAGLITDRHTGTNSFSGNDMVYQPVSTGFAVIADTDYEPKTMNQNIDFTTFLNQDGTMEEHKRTNFGQFPWLGNITAVVSVFNVLSSARHKDDEAYEIIADLEEMAEGGFDNDGDGLMETIGRRWAVSALAVVKETAYGGVRIMVGVAFTSGDKGYQRNANPYRSFTEFVNWNSMIWGFNQLGEVELLKKEPDRAQKAKELKSQFGGPYFSFSLYVGLYVDFGYIAIQDTESETGYTDISHDFVLMGAGGFFGAMFKGGYTITLCTPIFWYINFEAGLNVTVFIGASADPLKTLESAYYDSDQVFGDDWGFTFDIDGRASFSGAIGIGYYKIMGARCTASVGVQAGFSLKMHEFFPDLDGNDYLSYATDITFTGTLDLIVTSIDLWSASWPLPWNDGWLGYFQQSGRAERLILYINKGINAKDGSDEARAYCRQKNDELAAYKDLYAGSGDTLKEMVDDLKEYAYDHGVISWHERNMVDALRMGGIIGGAMNMYAETHDAEEQSLYYHTNDHVESEWVAGEEGSLMAAFGPVSSSKLLENTPNSTASEIIPIGNGKYLMTFIDDDNSRERQQSYVLKYTVYDSNTDTWTVPAVLQDDGTADNRANLVDAGDKIIVTWTSIEKEKYETLKEKVADEISSDGDATEEMVFAYLEDNPTVLLENMDVFTVQFDKETETFGEIEQLTDDAYYDSDPKAVYDEETGDYIVLYYKTAQDAEAYDSEADRLNDMVSSNPGDNTYSVLAYMLYNNQTDAADTEGNTHESGWARDYLFRNETSQTVEDQKDFLARWGGQRFLASALREEDGGQTDMPISDLTVSIGYNGKAAYAFTVDKDYDLETTEDRDLFIQFYDFFTHSTYVPVKIAGEIEEEMIDRYTLEEYTRTTEVSVSDPRLVRNDGSTWLFWRQDDDGLRYINITELMNDIVTLRDDIPADADISDYTEGVDYTYAVRSDGTLAPGYTPEIHKVDFGSALNDGKLTPTEYKVVTDNDDNIYVVWTDADAYTEMMDDIPITYPTNGIYASAMIKEEDQNLKNEDGTSTTTASWSRPYLLTDDKTCNDGIAITLGEDGSLMIVHNQFEMIYAESEEEQVMMIEKGLAGVKEQDGQTYFIGSPFYPSQIDLVLTKYEPVGSVEATGYVFSDDTPVAGDLIEVIAAIENTGLTTAEGCEISFYEYRDGIQGERIATITSDDRFPVNTAKKFTFEWTVPDDGPEGYCIQAVCKEKKTDGTYYDPIEKFSGVFELKDEYELTVETAEQNGDVFDMKYQVTNTGNMASPDGYTAKLFLEALYGDIKEQYGMDSDILISEDISGLAPGETRVIEKSVKLPVSVFEFCGFDAVSAGVESDTGKLIESTEHNFIKLEAPINLSLSSESLALKEGQTATETLSYDSTLFMDVSGAVIYSVDDPSVASVDADGKVTALGAGKTTLTATVFPSGRSVSIPVEVTGNWKDSGENPFVDVSEGQYYYDPVLWAVANGITKGVDETHFAPDAEATRGQFVTFLWRAAGSPAPESENNPFTDVKTTDYFYEPVLWAVENGITKGTSATTFSPNETCKRCQIVTFLHRYEGEPEPESTNNPFTDVKAGDYFYEAVLWAVENEITNGMSKTKFSPNSTATRGQVMTFLYRDLVD